jgi:hypothetical protein
VNYRCLKNQFDYQLPANRLYKPGSWLEKKELSMHLAAQVLLECYSFHSFCDTKRVIAALGVVRRQRINSMLNPSRL